MTYLPNQEFFLEVIRGNVPGMSYIDKFGRNNDIDNAGGEDIWGVGGSLVYRTAADTVAVVSDNAADASAGTGARQIRIFGLDASYNEINETITLNGTTPVTTSNSYLRIFRAYVTVVGSGESNAGTITGAWTTGADPAFNISTFRGQSAMGLYTIPAGKTGYLVSYEASLVDPAGANADRSALVAFNTRLYNASSNNNYEGWRVTRDIDITVRGNSTVLEKVVLPDVLPARTDIRVSATVSDNNTQIVVRYGILLIDD